MTTRVAVISIIVEDGVATEKINEYLHIYKQYILGRMGIPYRERKISVISVVLDAPEDKISALSGKLGRLKGVSIKTVYSQKVFDTIGEGENCE
ncbi:MAG: iron-only hydrogenase system regulator [Spirochaetales bacterium]|nr:iron-only hydrogenase system regulator [Spirochaetales bacterium]